MQRCSLAEIIKSANLLPFEQQHIKFLISLLKEQNAKGLGRVDKTLPLTALA
jgi:hypothetical protein